MIRLHFFEKVFSADLTSRLDPLGLLLLSSTGYISKVISRAAWKTSLKFSSNNELIYPNGYRFHSRYPRSPPLVLTDFRS